MVKISIVGFGDFGKFIVKHSKDKAEVVVTDISDKHKEAEELGVKFVSFDDALKNKIIILAVPMENFIETLNKIKDGLTPGSLIIDVCSLKKFSCSAMKETLPENIEAIGTHPLFGPLSAPNNLDGLRIALCNVSAKEETFENVKSFCEDLGLRTFVVTPEEHDKQMAVSQALTHFIGRAVKNMNVKKVDLSTKTFDDLMDIINTIKNDSPELFHNMQTMNPFATKVRKEFVEACEKIEKDL